MWKRACCIAEEQQYKENTDAQYMAGNLKPSFRNVGPWTGGDQKCRQGSPCKSMVQEGWIWMEVSGQRVPEGAVPAPLNLPRADGSRGAREENVPEEWKQESHSLCSHSAKNWSSSRHLSVLSRRRVFISCHRWPCSSLQSENGCTQDVSVGASSPCLGRKWWGTPTCPACTTHCWGVISSLACQHLHLSGWAWHGFQNTPSHELRLSPLNLISYPTCDSTNIHWTSVQYNCVNHVWTCKRSIPNG